MGKAAVRSAATLIATGVQEDGIHAATITIAGSVVRGTAFDPDNISDLFWAAHTDPTDHDPHGMGSSRRLSRVMFADGRAR
jgi:hypothetical protein